MENVPESSFVGDDRVMLHRCSPPVEVTMPGVPVQRLPYRTIDVHCHLMVPAVEKLVAGYPEKENEIALNTEMMGEESVKINKEMFAELLPKLIDVDRRLNDMDAMGVDVQVITSSPTQYYYWAEQELAELIVNQQNDEIERLCSAYPDKFLGMGTVAMQYPSVAAAQLQELVKGRGFKGVQISSLVNGMDVADPFFDPFWEKANELGAIVFIHPWGTTLGKRLSDHYLINTIGQPLETTICLSKLILGGTFDRYQKIKIIAAHGGGYLPLYVSRMDHASAARADTGCCACRPSDYLSRIWFDSVVYDPDHLSRLIDMVGASRVVIGTDYPFDMGHYDPSALVSDLETSVQRQILGGNAERLFGLMNS